MNDVSVIEGAEEFRKKGYYVYFGESSSLGVNNKINMQIHELAKSSVVAKLLISPIRRNVIQRILGLFPFSGNKMDYDTAFRSLVNPDYLYIRRNTTDKDYIGFLRKVKEKFPRCIIVIEIPTFPIFWDSYCHNFFHLLRSFPDLLREVIYRGEIKKYIDFFVTFSDQKKIYGVETIRTFNGIIVETVKEVNKQERDNSKINLISVASMAPHSGFERLIKGIHKYYQLGGNRNINFKIVGNGKEVKKYLKLIRKYRIQNHVFCLGERRGTELDELYNNSDIAVSSLGLYKYRIFIGSFIKIGEYLSKGLPVLLSCKTKPLNEFHNRFVCEFSNDRNSIDIEKVIEFYDSEIRREKPFDVVKFNRSFALEYLSMELAMLPIKRRIGI